MKRKVRATLNEKDCIRVQETVENEGSLDYAFRFYSHFPEIKDKKFQKLRKAYVKAAQELSDYCRLEEEIEGEEQHEADKIDSSECQVCGDMLDKDGFCGTCLDRD